MKSGGFEQEELDLMFRLDDMRVSPSFCKVVNEVCVYCQHKSVVTKHSFFFCVLMCWFDVSKYEIDTIIKGRSAK